MTTLRTARRELDLRAAGADGHRQRDARLVLRRAGGARTPDALVARAAALAAAGAGILDVGGESGITPRPPIGARRRSSGSSR